MVCSVCGAYDELVEMAACAKYLDRQIELVDPKLIVTLGRFAFGRYFPGEGITNARGKLRVKDGRNIEESLRPEQLALIQGYQSALGN